MAIYEKFKNFVQKKKEEADEAKDVDMNIPHVSDPENYVVLIQSGHK